MLDTLVQPTAEVVAAIEALRPPLQPKRLTIEECTTPELRLEYIAQWLEAGGDERGIVGGFGMSQWASSFECGSTCCIGGSACSWWGGRDMKWVYELSCSSDAIGILGLDYASGMAMFFPCGYGKCNDAIDADPAWAARMIRHYQKTGEVDWNRTR